MTLDSVGSNPVMTGCWIEPRNDFSSFTFFGAASFVILQLCPLSALPRFSFCNSRAMSALFLSIQSSRLRGIQPSPIWVVHPVVLVRGLQQSRSLHR